MRPKRGNLSLRSVVKINADSSAAYVVSLLNRKSKTHSAEELRHHEELFHLVKRLLDPDLSQEDADDLTEKWFMKIGQYRFSPSGFRDVKVMKIGDRTKRKVLLSSHWFPRSHAGTEPGDVLNLRNAAESGSLNLVKKCVFKACGTWFQARVEKQIYCSDRCAHRKYRDSEGVKGAIEKRIQDRRGEERKAKLKRIAKAVKDFEAQAPRKGMTLKDHVLAILRVVKTGPMKFRRSPDVTARFLARITLKERQEYGLPAKF